MVPIGGPPSSLFNTVIPEIIRGGNDLYFSLKFNHNRIEDQKREKGNYKRKVSSENCERLLTRHTIVSIPITCVTIHHKLVELYGHDRILELEFISSASMPNGDTQLTFRTLNSNLIRERWQYVACRSNGLGTYPFAMYVTMTDEEIGRDILRMDLVMWRHSVHSTADRLLEEELKRGNVHKDHASFLRRRVRNMIARTHEEHVEHKKAIANLCRIGREYTELMKKKIDYELAKE
jgi:hypothetical protein